MSTVNLDISTVARIIHLLTKRQSHAETNMAHDLARAIELAATTEPKTIAVSSPDGKRDERLMQQVFSARRDRIRFDPKYWLTPPSPDVADALNMAFIDWAKSPSARDLLEEIVTATGSPSFVWRNMNNRTLTAKIIHRINADKGRIKELGNDLVERFNLLEALRAQLSVENWDQMAGALADLKKQRDSHSDSAEILDFIVKTLKVLPGTDIVKHVEALVENDKKSKAAEAEIRELMNIEPDDGPTMMNLREYFQQHARLITLTHDLKRDVKMYQESAAYRGQCLDQIADMLGIEPSMNTPAQIVAEVSLLKLNATQTVNEAIKSVTANAVTPSEQELLRMFRNRVIKVVQNHDAYGSHHDFMNDLRDAVNHGVK